MAERSVLGRGLSDLIVDDPAQQGPEADRARRNYGGYLGALDRQRAAAGIYVDKDGAMTTQERLELREKQLVACTRALLDASSRLKDIVNRPTAARDESWLDVEAIADELAAVRAGEKTVQMEAVTQKMRREYLVLLTPAQAHRLDEAIMLKAKGDERGPWNEQAVLMQGERYPLDAAREI